ncbi:hypothetical protein GCM10027517_30640 [Phycicoccus ginsengisoli]
MCHGLGVKSGDSGLGGGRAGGCGSGGAASSSSDKYEQTWTTSYAKTTCADYTQTMTVKQRWVMAADMLVSSRGRGKRQRGGLDVQGATAAGFPDRT